MALDHFVPQVHLRHFISPVLGNRLYAIRKSDLARFTPRTKDVCRIEDGSTNAYLREDRAIEEFLKAVEPQYNAALAKLRDDEIDQESIFVMAGFAAYVACCTPAAMRIHSPPLRALVESEAAILDRQGVFEKAPPALGGKTLTELLEDGTVHVAIDGKFPQALGITTILGRASIWGNSPWEILHNDAADTPFFTSDHPAAIEQRPDNIMNRIVPLAPNLAIRIIPDVNLARTKPDLSFSRFRFRHRNLSRAEIIDANRLIVQCAEDLVLFRDERDWIVPFMAKHRDSRIESLTDRIPHGTGFLTVARQRIVKRAAA
jgi:hypothetical protein